MSNDHYECCLRCQSRRVVIGRFVQQDGFYFPAGFRCFQPTKFWPKLAYKLGIGQKIIIPTTADAFLCLNCGTCWTSIDLVEAKSKIRTGANPVLRKSLGLVEKSTVPDDELA
jgi:hypothetical protein